MLDGKAWLSVSALIHPKGVLSGWGQDSVQASQVHPHQTLSSMSLWTLLCALVHSHVGTGRGHPKTVPSSWKTALCHNSPSTKLYTWHNAVRQVPFSWQPPKPDSSIRLPDAETQFLTPEKASPLLCSPVVACFTPLHPRSCSAMETHSMKLSMNMRPHEVLRFIAVDSAESWRPLCTLCVSICWPAPSFYVADHFVAELLSFQVTSTLLHWQVTVEYLGARNLLDWTCCTGGILSQYHGGHWAPENDLFFHRCL